MNAREKWKNQHWGGKARDPSGTRTGVPGLLGGGWKCICPVLLSGWQGVTGSVCLWAGRASIPAVATPEMLVGGA